MPSKARRLIPVGDVMKRLYEHVVYSILLSNVLVVTVVPMIGGLMESITGHHFFYLG